MNQLDLSVVELARDLLQDTYLKALRHLDGYRGQGPLLSWLRGIALRICLDWRRGLGRRLRQLVSMHRDDLDLEVPAPDRSEARDAGLSVTGRTFQAARIQVPSASAGCEPATLATSTRSGGVSSHHKACASADIDRSR